MPRRNLQVLIGLTLLSLLCVTRVSHSGRILDFAIGQINLRYLENVDRRTLFEGAMQGMADLLDEHSVYVSPERLAQFKETLDKEYKVYERKL